MNQEFLLVVEFVYSNPLLVVRSSQEIHKVPLEVVAEALDVLLGILANDLEVPDMALALNVTLEPVCVAALLLARLTPPAQPLQTLGLHLVGDPFCAACFGLSHCCGCGSVDGSSILKRIQL